MDRTSSSAFPFAPRRHGCACPPFCALKGQPTAQVLRQWDCSGIPARWTPSGGLPGPSGFGRSKKLHPWEHPQEREPWSSALVRYDGRRHAWESRLWTELAMPIFNMTLMAAGRREEGGGSPSQVYGHGSRQASWPMSHAHSVPSAVRRLCLGHQANGIPKPSVSRDAGGTDVHRGRRGGGEEGHPASSVPSSNAGGRGSIGREREDKEGTWGPSCRK